MSEADCIGVEQCGNEAQPAEGPDESPMSKATRGTRAGTRTIWMKAARQQHYQRVAHMVMMLS